MNEPVSNTTMPIAVIMRLSSWLMGLTLVALFSSLGNAFFRYQQVKDQLSVAHQMVGQGRLAEAESLARRAGFEQPSWAACFSGYTRAFGIIRIRCLSRADRIAEAVQMAESLMQAGPTSLPTPASDPSFFQAPLFRIRNWGLAFFAERSRSAPEIDIPRPEDGYAALFEELIVLREAAILDQLTRDLATRYPRSPISVYANAARGELMPVDPPRPVPPTPAARASRPPSPSDATGDTDQTEAPHPAPRAFAPAWAIVTNAHTQAYNAETDQMLRPLTAGDVLVLEGPYHNRGSGWLTGTLILNNRNIPNLAFRKSALELYSGSFADVPPAVVAMRSRLAEINVEESTLAAEAAAEHASRSPEEAALLEAERRMDAFQKQAKDLQNQFDQATGNARSALLDRLRQMKYEEQTLLRDLESKRAALASTGRPSSSGRSEARLGDLRKEKAAILKRLAEESL